MKMPFPAIWIQLEIVILSEINQKEKDKYLMPRRVQVHSYRG